MKSKDYTYPQAVITKSTRIKEPRKFKWYLYPLSAFVFLLILGFIFWGTQRPKSTFERENSFNNDIEVTVRGHNFHFKFDSSLYYYLLSIQFGGMRDENRVAFLQSPNDKQLEGLAIHYNQQANYYSSLAIRYDSTHSGIYRVMEGGIMKQSDSSNSSADYLK